MLAGNLVELVVLDDLLKDHEGTGLQRRAALSLRAMLRQGRVREVLEKVLVGNHVFAILGQAPDDDPLGNGVLLFRVVNAIDDVVNVGAAAGLLATDFSGDFGDGNNDVQVHFQDPNESNRLLSILKENRKKVKIF